MKPDSVLPSPQALSRLGPRASYGQALLSLAERYDFVAMSADLGSSSGLERFRTKFPDRFVNVGIAEQHLVGFAAGVALLGRRVFASSFAPFITMRAAEQVRLNLGYMRAPVCLVGLGSGLAMGLLGNSHYGLEDIAVMRTVPGLTVLSPSDPHELVQMLEWIPTTHEPIYLRLTGVPGQSPLSIEESRWSPREIKELRKGADCVLLATGAILGEALSAAETLAQAGVQAGVYGISTLKPLDEHAVRDIAHGAGLVVTIEEHLWFGGLGSAVAEIIGDAPNNRPLLRIGLPDSFGPTARYERLLQIHGLTGESIAERVLNRLGAS